ncbi:hypothetical protein ASG40_17000 [Methylobacterium sp. Leaf399]|uniref:hypothetical protein n=1 Tax=Methylobacterium sp. Leaf399 TaxID=1736364 RepID=UPI000715C59C|nr:hypothetical protein [Methylobacterium sp. Leaf399]KQT17719.1 hypothetical protein ASG40_17000 [Methylobacterium sp. Leaf399]
MAAATHLASGADMRLALRQQIERAIEAAFDTAYRLIVILDEMTGDPDFEPETDREDNGDTEPAMAALVGSETQTRWVGFEMGVAA